MKLNRKAPDELIGADPLKKSGIWLGAVIGLTILFMHYSKISPWPSEILKLIDSLLGIALASAQLISAISIQKFHSANTINKSSQKKMMHNSFIEWRASAGWILIVGLGILGFWLLTSYSISTPFNKSATVMGSMLCGLSFYLIVKGVYKTWVNFHR